MTQAEIVAELRNLSLEERLNVIETAVHLIREDLQHEAAEEAEDIRVVDEIEARVATGEEQVRDWAEFERELDDLET